MSPLTISFDDAGNTFNAWDHNAVNVAGLTALFGSRKRLGRAIDRDRTTVCKWEKTGLPLHASHAVADAIEQQAKLLYTLAQRLREAATKARSDGDKTIETF